MKSGEGTTYQMCCSVKLGRRYKIRGNRQKRHAEVSIHGKQLRGCRRNTMAFFDTQLLPKWHLFISTSHGETVKKVPQGKDAKSPQEHLMKVSLEDKRMETSAKDSPSPCCVGVEYLWGEHLSTDTKYSFILGSIPFSPLRTMSTVKWLSHQVLHEGGNRHILWKITRKVEGSVLV